MGTRTCRLVLRAGLDVVPIAQFALLAGIGVLCEGFQPRITFEAAVWVVVGFVNEIFIMLINGLPFRVESVGDFERFECVI